MRKSKLIQELQDENDKLLATILRMAEERDRFEKTRPPASWSKPKPAPAISAGAQAYDRHQLLLAGATESEVGSVPDRVPSGSPKKWFTHPTNPNLDGWY